MDLERRYKIISIREQQIFALFRAASCDAGYHICVPVFNGLPLDTKVVAVHHNWQRDCFDLTIWSNDFDIVPECDLIPHLEYSIETVTLEERRVRKC